MFSLVSRFGSFSYIPHLKMVNLIPERSLSHALPASGCDKASGGLRYEKVNSEEAHHKQLHAYGAGWHDWFLQGDNHPSCATLISLITIYYIRKNTKFIIICATAHTFGIRAKSACPTSSRSPIAQFQTVSASLLTGVSETRLEIIIARLQLLLPTVRPPVLDLEVRRQDADEDHVEQHAGDTCPEARVVGWLVLVSVGSGQSGYSLSMH